MEVTSDHDRVRAADGVVLPGVGAFPKAMEAVRRLGLDELLHERRDAGVPILGICLGMQLLFESSTELGGAEGLGLLAGTVEAASAGPEGPAHRLEPGGVGGARKQLREGLPEPVPRCTTCTRSRPAR